EVDPADVGRAKRAALRLDLDVGPFGEHVEVEARGVLAVASERNRERVVLDVPTAHLVDHDDALHGRGDGLRPSGVAGSVITDTNDRDPAGSNLMTVGLLEDVLAL